MLSIDGSFEIHLFKCMHGPSFKTLAVIVSEKIKVYAAALILMRMTLVKQYTSRFCFAGETKI